MINLKRPDVYRSIHKAIRKSMFDFSLLAGKIDFQDLYSLKHLKEQFYALTNLLISHGDHEDAVCIPLLESKRPGCTTHNQAEHIRLHQRIIDMEKQLITLIETRSDKREEEAWLFYYEVNGFISEYLKHMEHEEFELTGLFYELCTDEELGAMSEQIMQRIPAAEMGSILRKMIPAMFPKDRAQMIGHISLTAPSDTFDALMILCRTVLTEKEYLQLEHTLKLNAMDAA